MTIEQYIRQTTNDGKTLVDFLVDTVQGSVPHATVSHRLKSTEWLAKLGGLIPETDLTTPAKTSAPSRPRVKKSERKTPITEKQILNYEIAQLIKTETRNGESIIQFLLRVVLNGETFTPAARMRAVKELLFRGFGSTSPYTRRILSGSAENLGSDFSKHIRECADFSAQSVTFLIAAMENKALAGASKGFTPSQRVWAACELLRRAYDIKTDHITPADIQAYRSAQTPASNPAAPAQSGRSNNPASAPTDGETRQPEAAANSASVAPDGETLQPEPVETKAAALAQSGRSNNPVSAPTDGETRQREAAESKAAANTPANNPVNAEKPAQNSVNTDVVAQKPAQNSVSPETTATNHADSAHNAATGAENPDLSRAARRRQQRADRKAQKRANNRPQKPNPRQPDSIHVAPIPGDDQAALDAFIAYANANNIPYFILESDETGPCITATNLDDP